MQQDSKEGTPFLSSITFNALKGRAGVHSILDHDLEFSRLKFS